jgi:adenylate kinase
MIEGESMIVVFLGPPGTGKGTQAKLIHERFLLPHISTGDILRAAVASGSNLGRKVKRYLDAGELVPDDLMVELIADRIEGDGYQQGFILDGFPRTVPQAEMLDKMLNNRGKGVTLVLNLILSTEKIISRLLGRLHCSSCGACYNIELDTLKDSMVCDSCGGELVRRSDDTEEVIRRRIEVYDKKTAPVITYYRRQGKLVDIDGNGTIEKVFKKIVLAVEKLKEREV